MIGEEHSGSEEHNGALTFTGPRVGCRPSGSSSEEHQRIKSRQRRRQPSSRLHDASEAPENLIRRTRLICIRVSGKVAGLFASLLPNIVCD